MEKHTPNYFAIIPANVRYSDAVCANAKLLYGEITALSNAKGYCYASNRYFADLYKLKRLQTVSDWVKQLEKAGFISVELIYNGGEIEQRIIKICNAETLEVQRKNVVPITKKRCEGTTKKRCVNNTEIIKKNNSSGLQSSPTPPLPFFLDFQSWISDYSKELGTLGLHKPEELYSILLNNLGVEIVKENPIGVSEADAEKIKSALVQIKSMTMLHESEKNDIQSNGKKWFKKSLKRLISTQAYTRLPEAAESSPEASKTASSSPPQDWKIQFCADLAKKGLNSSMTPEKIKPILTGVGLAFGKYIPIADKDGMRCAVAAFLSSQPKLDYSGGGYEGENRVKQAFIQWSKTEAGRAFGEWAAKRKAAANS